MVRVVCIRLYIFDLRHHRIMNYERVLRVTNYVLVLTGYQLHSFHRSTYRYRLSLVGVANFTIVALLYAICFNHHFEPSAWLQLVHDVSPFLWYMVRLQLLLGAKVFVFNLYEIRTVIRAANGLAEIFMPLVRLGTYKWNRKEAYVYFMLSSTLLISFILGLYIAYEMEFKSPPLDHILLSLALFIPHFTLAGALKFYNVGNWLFRTQLHRLSEDFDAIMLTDEETKETAIQLEDSSDADATLLLQVHDHIVHLTAKRQQLNHALQRQLALLIVLNTNCLLVAVYLAVYFESTWHVMFDDRRKRVFHTANFAIFLLIFWDYLCLCLTQSSLNRVRDDFSSKLKCCLKEKGAIVRSANRPILKSLRDLLANEPNATLVGIFKFDTFTFLLVQKVIAIVIALTVIYHYLNDQIKSLSDRLDSIELDDE